MKPMNTGVVCVAFMLCILLSGCVSFPEPRNIQRSFDFDESFDDVWEGVMHFFSSENIPIKTIEKDSGIIYAEKEFLLQDHTSDFAECPTEGISLVASNFLSMKMNIFVSTQKDETTTVTVNLTYHRVYKNVWTEELELYECYSTGRLERLIHDEIREFLK